MASRLQRDEDAPARDSVAENAPPHRSLLLNDLVMRLLPHDRQPGSTAGSTLPHAILDLLVFTTLALGFGAWLQPDDVFGLRAGFPWTWLVPAVIAMRHGSSIGVGSVILYVLAWLLCRYTGQGGVGPDTEFPKSFFLGGVALVLICGQFSDMWHARSRRLNGINEYLEERLQTLTKSHFLLRLSHERLEQDLLVKPVTLRETLQRLRQLTAQARGETGKELPGAQEFMQLLGQSCQLEVAALYALDVDGKLIPTPCATIGAITPLDANDALLRHALDENILTHVQSETLADERDASQYLVAAPLLPSVGRALGVLVVEKLPFLALNEEALQLLAVLTDYYADGLTSDIATRKVVARVPSCPPALALDVVRLHRVRLQGGIDSSLVALVFDNDDTSIDILEQVKRLKRGVDLSWEIHGARHTALITLLPLAGSAAVEGYLLRVEEAVQAQFGDGFLKSGVAIHTARVGFSPPAATLSHLVARCGL